MLDAFIEMSKLVLEPIDTSCVAKPIPETTNVLAVLGMDNENLPFASDVVPVVVPFTITEPLATGLPLSSLKVPEIVRFWAEATSTKPNATNKVIIIFLICSFDFK